MCRRQEDPLCSGALLRHPARPRLCYLHEVASRQDLNLAHLSQTSGFPPVLITLLQMGRKGRSSHSFRIAAVSKRDLWKTTQALASSAAATGVDLPNSAGGEVPASPSSSNTAPGQAQQAPSWDLAIPGLAGLKLPWLWHQELASHADLCININHRSGV